MTTPLTPAEIAIASLEATAAVDLARLGALMDDDIVMRFPFAPESVPNQNRGKENCLKMTEQIFSMLSYLKFVGLQAHPTQDPELVFVTGASDAQAANGRPYSNEYVFKIRVRNGRIVEHVEYFNPLKVIESFQ